MKNCPRRNQRKPKEVDMTIIDTTSGIQDILVTGSISMDIWMLVIILEQDLFDL